MLILKVRKIFNSWIDKNDTALKWLNIFLNRMNVLMEMWECKI